MLLEKNKTETLKNIQLKPGDERMREWFPWGRIFRSIGKRFRGIGFDGEEAWGRPIGKLCEAFRGAAKRRLLLTVTRLFPPAWGKPYICTVVAKLRGNDRAGVVAPTGTEL